MVKEVKYRLPKYISKVSDESDSDVGETPLPNRMVVDLNVDWLYEEIYLIIMQKEEGRKTYDIVTCDIGKFILFRIQP